MRAVEEKRPFSRPVQLVVQALLGGPATIAELVAASGAPRRQVEQLLAALAPDLVRDGDRYVLPARLQSEYAEAFGLPQLAERVLDDVVGGRLAARADLVAFVAGLAGSRPRPERNLDHVAATPETVARRALWLDAVYDLGRAELLCIGDHDLTSLAVASCAPGAGVTVVDVDDRVLEFIDGVARRHEWRVRCLWGDFRLGLPSSANGVADIAVTDPPYTPEGVSTFLVAALQGLADPERGRIVMAYGYGEHQPGLGLKVQQAVLDMAIAFEAIYPAFNRYEGAQAIGSRSDLYVCRPTARTYRALPKLMRQQQDARIYTHGEKSLESRAPEARAALEEVLGSLGSPEAGPSRLLLVGDTWPPGQVTAGAQRTSLGALLAQGLPPQLGHDRDVHVLLDLTAGPPAWLLRALLAVNAGRVVAVVPAGSWSPGEAALLRDKYEVAARRLRDSTFELVTATPAPETSSRVARDVLSRSHGRLGNVWREALVSGARAGGGSLTKNEARALVANACSVPDLLGVSLVEAPRHLLEIVVPEIRRSQPSAGERPGLGPS